MIERKEPVAGDLDRATEAMVSLSLGRAGPAFAAAAADAAREMRADVRAPRPRESRLDMWFAGAVFSAAVIGLGLYFWLR